MSGEATLTKYTPGFNSLNVNLDPAVTPILVATFAPVAAEKTSIFILWCPLTTKSIFMKLMNGFGVNLMNSSQLNLMISVTK